MDASRARLLEWGRVALFLPWLLAWCLVPVRPAWSQQTAPQIVKPQIEGRQSGAQDVPGQTAPRPPEPSQSPVRQAVAVLGDDRFVAGALEQMDREVLGAAEALWVWGPDLAPRRLEAGALSADGGIEGLAPSPRRLLVHLPPGPREGWELLAAPTAFWLEVPEDRVPRWPVPQRGAARLPDDGEAWTLRLVAPRRGGWWTGAEANAGTVDLTLFPARDRRIRVVDPHRQPVPAASVSLLVGPPGTARERMVARARVVDGELLLRALPDADELALVVGASGFLPATWRSFPSALPERLELREGAALHGRFVDDEERPLAGVEVVVEGWLGDEAAALLRRSATSGPAGRWRVEALPPGSLALEARKDGFSDHARSVAAEAGTTDLGELVLRPGVAVAVRVVDDLAIPVADARLHFGAQRVVTTGPRGRAVLEGLPAGEPTPVRLSAPGHLETRVRVEAPGPVTGGAEGSDGEEIVLRLPRAFGVTGRVVAPDGTPSAAATVVVETGSRSQRHELPGHASFHLDLEPDRHHRLAIASPDTLEVRVPVEPGVPGEVRDLGEIHLREGMTVLGRAWSDLDGLPLAGARIWTLRPSEAGAALAWMRGDLVQARSDGEGQFTLRGLPRRPHLLRVDAPGHARRHVEVAPSDDGGPVDVGEVELGSGGRVEVLLDRPASGAVARADLRGEWLEADMLTAPMVDGLATLETVPPGDVLLTVVDGRDVLCETSVPVSEGETTTVECGNTGVDVSGVVLVGGRPTAEGTLSWRHGDQLAVAGVILNRVSDRGARQQQLFGAGRAPKEVPVDPSGHFRVEDLAPGSWEVTWHPGGGSFTPSRTVEVPAFDVRDLELDFPGSVVPGRVVGEHGEPVAGARVQAVTGRASALSDPGGGFRLVGLESGTHRLFARSGERTSREVEVVVEPGRTPEPVVLTLARRQDGRLQVRVLDRDGRPGAGALVVVEPDAGTARILTTDRAGQATVSFDPPRPARVRLAVLHGDRWGFLPQRPFEEDGDAGGMAVDLVVGETGDLLLSSDEGVEAPRIVSREAGDVTGWLQRVGIPLRVPSGAPLRLAGLPPGTYTVATPSGARTVQVRRGEVTEVELP